MQHISYKTSGTCSQLIDLTGRDGRIESVVFFGGCHGNLQGISRLVEGLTYDEAIRRLDGIRCGNKPTSCPDQLCRAIEQLRRQPDSE